MSARRRLLRYRKSKWRGSRELSLEMPKARVARSRCIMLIDDAVDAGIYTMQEEASCRSGVASDAPCGIFELKKAGTGHRGLDRRLQLVLKQVSRGGRKKGRSGR